MATKDLTDTIIALTDNSILTVLNCKPGAREWFLADPSRTKLLGKALRPLIKTVSLDWHENAQERADAMVSEATLQAALAADCMAAASAAVEQAMSQ